MPRDINRLFSMINQADLPYQVFEDARWDAVTPIVEPSMAAAKPPVPERDLPANEDAPQAHAGLFRAYNVEAALAVPRGTPLADVFSRMGKR